MNSLVSVYFAFQSIALVLLLMLKFPSLARRNLFELAPKSSDITLKSLLPHSLYDTVLQARLYVFCPSPGIRWLARVLGPFTAKWSLNTTV